MGQICFLRFIISLAPYVDTFEAHIFKKLYQNAIKRSYGIGFLANWTAFECSKLLAIGEHRVRVVTFFAHNLAAIRTTFARRENVAMADHALKIAFDDIQIFVRNHFRHHYLFTQFEFVSQLSISLYGSIFEHLGVHSVKFTLHRVKHDRNPVLFLREF